MCFTNITLHPPLILVLWQNRTVKVMGYHTLHGCGAVHEYHKATITG